MKLKNIISMSVLLGGLVLSSCNPGGNEKRYTVSEEEYNSGCSAEKLISNMTTLNFTATFRESVGTKRYEYLTEFDNGKIHSVTSYDEFYIRFYENNYVPSAETWKFDGIYRESEDDERIKVGPLVDTLPDDIILPTVANSFPYSEIQFDAETSSYKLIEEPKILNLYYYYTDFEAKFENGKIMSYKYKYYDSFSPEVVYDTSVEITKYGTTTVNVPNIN